MNTIPQNEADYFYATYSKVGEKGGRSMYITGNIMPTRVNAPPQQAGIASRYCMWGVDIMFLAEALATRSAIVNIPGPSADTLAMTREIKSSRLYDIYEKIGYQWYSWAILRLLESSISSFRGVILSQSPLGRIDTNTLRNRLATELRFSSAVGTRKPPPSDLEYRILRKTDVENLFWDIAKMQCAVIPIRAEYEIIGMNDGSSLGSYSGVDINKTPDGGYHAHTGPNYATELTVSYRFPRAAGGSRVMLFAYVGGHTWTARDYPRDQDNGNDAQCLVPTDGEWHVVAEDGSLTAHVDAQATFQNIVEACSFPEKYPTPPPDDDPDSTKNRQASWSYFLKSTNGGVTFIALFDLKHTNISLWEDA